jgi:hypothetical protein
VLAVPRRARNLDMAAAGVAGCGQGKDAGKLDS